MSAPVCVYCGGDVTNPAVVYCRECHYSGTDLNYRFADLIADLPTTMDGAGWWHTGGGCFALRIPLGDGYLLATGDEGVGDPDDEQGPWVLGRYPDDGTGDGDIVAEGLDRDGLLAAIEHEAAR